MSSPVHEFLTIDIPASLVLTLKTSPVLLVAGEALYLMNVYNLVVKYVAGTTPFNPTSTDAFAAYTGDGTETGSLLLYPGANYLAKGFVDQAVNHTMYMDAWLGTNGSLTGGLSAAPASSIVGSGLYLSQFNSGSTFPSGSNWTQGNGSLVVEIEYSYLLA